MTQKQRLLEWLQETGPINPLLAWRRLGIYRLSSVIHLLRKDGWNIVTNTIEVKNRFNETCQVGEYILRTDDWTSSTQSKETYSLSEIAEHINNKSSLNSPEEVEQMDLGL